MPEVHVLIKILLIPFSHCVFGILLPGACLLCLPRAQAFARSLSRPGLWLAVTSLGILASTLQFALAALIHRQFPLLSQAWLGAGKYVADLAFLLFVFRFRRPGLRETLMRLAGVFSRRGDAALLLLALLLGLAAVLNFPHVHDSGQLMVTNQMLRNGTDFWRGQRFGLAFSALLYFPAAIFKAVPLSSLASGFKLFLLFLTGMTALYGIDRLGTLDATAAKFLYFIIVVSSFFGLYGLMELGKDSAWAVLLTLVFLFSLFARRRGQPLWEPLLYLACAASLGMIALPYLALFCCLAAAVHMLPVEIRIQRMLFPFLILLMLAACFMLMPVKMALAPSPSLQPLLGNIVFWPPTDGSMPFGRYFFLFAKFGYANSPPLIAAGLLGMLLLAAFRKRFNDPMVRATALFLPVATAGCLLLANMARGVVPIPRETRIPFTPFTTFDAWNLVKDIPQWLVQIVSGIFVVLLLDAASRRVASAPRTRRAVFRVTAALTATVVLSANLVPFASLARPARFLSYGGNRDAHLARTLETIYRHPEIRQIMVQKGVSLIRPAHFTNDIRNYFSWKKVYLNLPGDADAILAGAKKRDFMLIAERSSLPGLAAGLERRGFRLSRELEVFTDLDEGIYIVAKKKAQQARPGIRSRWAGRKR